MYRGIINILAVGVGRIFAVAMLIVFTSSYLTAAVAAKPAATQAAAKTVAPYFFARKTDVSPLPHPRSRTRIPSFRGSAAVSSSAISHESGPIIFSFKNFLSIFTVVLLVLLIDWWR